MDIREPEIRKDEVLILQDSNFNPDNVCIVTGCGTGIGRATAIAASANKLMTVGLDINEKEGKKTQKIARDMGGQIDRTRNFMVSQGALRLVTPAKAGVQKTSERLDSRLRGNDAKRRLVAF